ncbi:MAG: OmpA family protein [Bacteroidota bacterium]
MKYLYLLYFFNLLSIVALAQSTAEEVENIVPNPSFEEYSSTPIGWYYRGAHFSNVMRYWSSATAASPDAFGPKVRVPEHWADKGFGDQYAHSGESMAGITIYGCDKGKPHCREYVQVQLLEPLVPEQSYYIEFWVAALPRSLQTNNIGVHFMSGKANVRVDEPIFLEPRFNQEEIVTSNDHNWTRISGQFTAEAAADYILVGNFFPDSLTQYQLPENEQPLKFAYYYLDDFVLKKVPPILEVPLAPDDLSLLKLEQGRIFQLKNIFFDTDKAELLPRSYQELKKLLRIMRENPEMEIEIRGHTDSQGRDSYNSYLSRKRAKAVASYLWEEGIAMQRVHYIGLGSGRPVASNDTELGRKMNRRVEFLILKK